MQPPGPVIGQNHSELTLTSEGQGDQRSPETRVDAGFIHHLDQPSKARRAFPPLFVIRLYLLSKGIFDFLLAISCLSLEPLPPFTAMPVFFIESLCFTFKVLYRNKGHFRNQPFLCLTLLYENKSSAVLT